MADETLKLGLDTKDAQKGAKQLQDELKATNNRMVELVSELGRGEIESGQFGQELAQTSKRAAELSRQLHQVETATKGGGRGMADFSNAALQAGRILQDTAQGGIGGGLNNIEAFVTSFAKGPTGTILAAALTSLGVAFVSFKPQIQEFLKGFQTKPIEEFKGMIEELEGTVKELTDKPFKLDADFTALEGAKKQLDAIKEGLAAWEQAKSGRSSAEQKAGSGFVQEFSETGAVGRAALDDVEARAVTAAVANDRNVRKAQRAVFEQQRNQQETARAQAEAERLATEEMMRPGADPNRIAQLALEAGDRAKEAQAAADPELMKQLKANLTQARKDAQTKATADAGNLFKQVALGTNPEARETLAQGFRDAGYEQFAQMVERNSPEEVKRKRDQAIKEAGQRADNENNRKLDALQQAEQGNQAKARDAEAKRVEGVLDDANSLLSHTGRVERSLDREQDQKAKAARDKQAQQDKQERLDQIRNLNETSSLDEQAALYATQLQGQGMAPDKRQAALQAAIAGQLPKGAQGLAPEMARQADQAATDQLIAGQIQAQQMGLQGQQATNWALQMALAAFQQTLAQQQQQIMKTQDLGTQFQRLGVQGAGRGF